MKLFVNKKRAKMIKFIVIRLFNHTFIIVIMQFRIFHFENLRPGNLDFNIDYTLTCSILLFDFMSIINYELQTFLTDSLLSLIRQLKS